MRLYRRLLGNPFVYDHIRPWVVGGIDKTSLYESLGATAEDVVLDVGCGTGDALDYLHGFHRYCGFDPDPVAIERARRRAAVCGGRATFEARLLTEADLDQIEPTRVVLAGLLHHLTDDETTALLGLLARSPKVERIVTFDTIYLQGRHFNNLLAWLDRGRYTRRQDGYQRLARNAGMNLVHTEIVPSHPVHGRVDYFIMTLEPDRTEFAAQQ